MGVLLEAARAAVSQPLMSKSLVVFAERAASMPGKQWRLSGRRVEAYLTALGVAPAARPPLVAKVIAQAASNPAWATGEQAPAAAMHCLRTMLAHRYRLLTGEHTATLSIAEAAAAWQALVWLRGRPEDILNEHFLIDKTVFRIGGRGRARLSSMPPMRRAPMAPKPPHFLSLRWLTRLFSRNS